MTTLPLQAWLLWATMTTVLSANPLDMLTSRIPKLHARLEKMESCADQPNTPIRFENFTIDQIGYNSFTMRGKIIIKETLDRPVRLELEMFRCRDKDDIDSCEYYFTFKKSGVCDLLELTDKSWQYFTDHSDLPTKCPFSANTYTVDGAGVDLKSLKFLPIFKSYWRIRSKGFKGEKLMFCAISEVSLEMRI